MNWTYRPDPEQSLLEISSLICLANVFAHLRGMQRNNTGNTVVSKAALVPALRTIMCRQIKQAMAQLLTSMELWLVPPKSRAKMRGKQEVHLPGLQNLRSCQKKKKKIATSMQYFFIF